MKKEQKTHKSCIIYPWLCMLQTRLAYLAADYHDKSQFNVSFPLVQLYRYRYRSIAHQDQSSSCTVWCNTSHNMKTYKNAENPSLKRGV